MKGKNVAVFFSDGDLSMVGGPARFGNLLNEVTAEAAGEAYEIKALTVVTVVSCISTSDDPDLEHKYDIMWTFDPIGETAKGLTRVSSDVLDVGKNKTEKRPPAVCRSFSNQVFKFTLRDYEIGEVDREYLLKVFLRNAGTTDAWQVQAIHSIYVAGCVKQV